MNILVGKQVSLDEDFSNLRVEVSPPRLSMNSKEINTSLRSATQKYELELEEETFQVLIQYSLEAIN
jgi:hypothetical protein